MIWRKEHISKVRRVPNIVETLTIRTRQKDEVVDITETIETYLRNVSTESGMCFVFVAHTTCALTTADLDPGTDRDLLDALRRLLPKMSYRHPHDPSHTPDHILSSLLGPSLAIPYQNRRLMLGTWQRVILVELDGPRQRTVHVSCMQG
jgi:secondary thiamine-phosphate synthase enzyme